VTKKFYKCSGVVPGGGGVKGGNFRKGTCVQKRLLHIEIGVGVYCLSVIYETPPETEEDLVARIPIPCETIQNTPGIFGRLRQYMVRGCNACNEDSGHYLEQRM
jgi:hypothetical protein